MNRKFLWSLAGAVLLAPAALNFAWGKAHVPLDQVQVCKVGDDGTYKAVNIPVSELAANLAPEVGACRLPACDFNNIFPPGEACPNVDANGDGFCDLENLRGSAVGETAACTGTPF